MNIAGMVLGIIAMMFAWVPIIGFISIPFVLVGLPLSFLGLRKNRRDGSGIGMSLTGLILNILALCFIVYYAVSIIFFVETVTT